MGTVTDMGTAMDTAITRIDPRATHGVEKIFSPLLHSSFLHPYLCARI